MTTIREAAQRAMEAWQTATYGHPSHHKATLLAMTALRAALAEPVQSAEANIGCLGMPVNTPVTPPQRTAEPVQEPFCYVYEYDSPYGLHREFYPREYNGMKPSRTVPLYTAPPPRKPLTDEKVCDLWSWSMTTEAERTATTQQHAFARAIERAHGIGDSDE